MEFPTSPAPHARPATTVPAVMRKVLYALVPAFAVYWWCFGLGIIVNLCIAVLMALLAEGLFLTLRGREAWPSLKDCSAIVTAALLVLALPPLTPWWIPALATATAIVLGKQLFGGLGANIFNPAMVGYVVVLISFPTEMTLWPLAITEAGGGIRLGLGDHLSYAVSGRLPPDLDIDAVTQATVLDTVKLGLANMQTLEEIRAAPMFGGLGGAGWQWVNLMIALGGLYLLYCRIIRWHIPVAVLAGVLLPAVVFNLFDSSRYPSPSFHLFTGAALLAAFFIATDPVSAAATPKGRLIYGAGIGALTYAIRTWGGYPDGVAFAVLLMNASVPILDRYTQPRIYGRT